MNAAFDGDGERAQLEPRQRLPCHRLLDLQPRATALRRYREIKCRPRPNVNIAGLRCPVSAPSHCHDHRANDAIPDHWVQLHACWCPLTEHSAHNRLSVIRSAPCVGAGTYVATVTAVSCASCTYDSGANVETSDSIAIP